MRPLLLSLVLLLTACAGHGQPPDDAEGHSGDLWAGVDFGCRADADCAVRNVGNCCGYYPACVNVGSPTFPERVLAQCEAEGLVSVCGFPELAGCRCVEGRCEGIAAGAQDLR
jgi:hypothetical protein